MRIVRPQSDLEEGGGRRSRRLRSIEMLPSLCTLTNLLCGFAAIHFALLAMQSYGAEQSASDVLTMGSQFVERLMPSYLSIGAGLIIVGMIFDGLDGMFARLTKNATPFGAQLDSLADIVTYGVAPAVLLLTLMQHELHEVQISLSPISMHWAGRGAWVSAVVYVACAAVRLARYNVEHEKEEFDHRIFRGLPSPAAASVTVAFLIFHEQARAMLEQGERAIGLTVGVAAFVGPIIALGTGALMVSSIPYRKITSRLEGRRPFGQLVGIIFLFAVFWSTKSLAMLAIAVWYVMSGPARLVYRRLKSAPAAAPDEILDQGRKTG
jgi:CDP-diacylglycerol--serine O-phosphatidyltransferase